MGRYHVGMKLTQGSPFVCYQVGVVLVCYLECSNLLRSRWFGSYDLSSMEGQDAVAMPMNDLNHTCGLPHTDLWPLEHSQVAHEPQLRF